MVTNIKLLKVGCVTKLSNKGNSHLVYTVQTTLYKEELPQVNWLFTLTLGRSQFQGTRVEDRGAMFEER